MLSAILKARGRTIMLRAATIEDLSAVYTRERDESGLGASQFSEAFVTNEAGGAVAIITYNARVWASRAPGAACLFDPYKESDF